ncbi:hypothetical protein [Streptomyces sp. MP131-18]|nr:hypothetical protein [Streptomyces sp. MP131-18]ONK12786.1 hypothetical protein STBA_35390 [Streptomyces sp. MP131-18]
MVTTGPGHVTASGVGTVNGLLSEVVSVEESVAVLAFSPAGG